MKCLTPEKTLTGDCEFLAANLYARSMFGESALANLSIEVGSNGFVQGKPFFDIWIEILYTEIDTKNLLQVISEYAQRAREWQSVWVIRSTSPRRRPASSILYRLIYGAIKYNIVFPFTIDKTVQKNVRYQKQN